MHARAGLALLSWHLKDLHPLWVFVVACILGSSGILWLKSGLGESDLAAGPAVISLFIPFLVCGLYLFFLTITGRIGHNRSTFCTIFLFLLNAFCFFGYFEEPLWHFYYDDPGRYSAYAKFMISQGTLWGNDAVSGVSANTPSFIDQPGYRYYLASMMLIVGDENRLLQLLNLFVYLSTLLLLLSKIDHDSKTSGRWICIFLVASLPYAASNILEGLSEWFAVSLFCLSVYTALQNWKFLAIICLALLPVVRQNLILFAFCYAIILIVLEPDSKRRLLYAISFILITLLPVYHNLFYAGEWQLISSNKGNMIPWDQSFDHIVKAFTEIIIRKLPQYIGYYETASMARTAITVAFAPLGTILVGYFLFRLRGYRQFFLFLTIILVAGPTTLFGWGYFPRLVFANLTLVLASIPLIQHAFPARNK